SEEHTSELQSLTNLVCRLLLEKKKHDPTARPRRIHPATSSTPAAAAARRATAPAPSAIRPRGIRGRRGALGATLSKLDHRVTAPLARDNAQLRLRTMPPMHPPARTRRPLNQSKTTMSTPPMLPAWTSMSPNPVHLVPLSLFFFNDSPTHPIIRLSPTPASPD